MSSIEHVLAHKAAEVCEEVELFGDGAKAHELSNIIKQHALLATGSAMIPVPGADLAAMAATVWTMYVRINEAVGVSFGDNVLKSIASGVIANLASVIPGVAIAMGTSTLLKFIPGIGTVGGMVVGAASNIAVLYVAGVVYLKSLEVLINSNESLTEDNIKIAIEKTSKDKDFVKNAYEEGKKVAKNR
ncbi:MAG: hypothetical protein WBM44_19915 [Waterburya sp.]